MVESSELSSLLLCTRADDVVADPLGGFDLVEDGCKNLKFNKLYHLSDATSGL